MPLWGLVAQVTTSLQGCYPRESLGRTSGQRRAVSAKAQTRSPHPRSKRTHASPWLLTTKPVLCRTRLDRLVSLSVLLLFGVFSHWTSCCPGEPCPALSICPFGRCPLTRGRLGRASHPVLTGRGPLALQKPGAGPPICPVSGDILFCVGFFVKATHRPVSTRT